MELIYKIGNKLGIDKAIAYTSSNGVLSAFIGVFSVFLYATCLTKEEQGYYYTFGSVMAIQVFFELGFTGIMTQYVAHENAHLKWDSDGVSLLGEDIYRSRLSSLLHFCLKWYFVIALLYWLVLQVGGFFFFKEFGNNDSISWLIPWAVLSLVSAWNLFTSPFFSFIKGIGLVSEIAEMGFYSTIVMTCITWVGLLLGFKLYSMALASLASSTFSVFYFYIHGLFYKLKSIWNVRICDRVNYMTEIFPYQWKIALSWISGYFIFNFMNPVIFATVGSVAAGQMGMSVNVLNSIRNFSMSWMSTKIPLISRLIELKDYLQLDRIFKKTIKQELFVCFAILGFFWLVIYALRESQLSINGKVIGERFLDYIPLLFMTIPVALQMVTDNFATYLRCHKKEPFLVISICSGLASAASVLLLGQLFGLYGITAGYALVSIVFFPWGLWIYRTKKKGWHHE